jgi:hypothetical protein
MALAPVAFLGNDIRVALMDAYGDGAVWAALEDGQGRYTQVCIDGRRGSPTRYRLFEQARHPRHQSAVLIELGALEEGVIVPLLSRWLDSGEPRKLGLTEAGKEILQAGLMHFGEPPWMGNGLLLEVLVPRPMELSKRQEIERDLAAALEASHLGEVTGGGFGGGVTDFFVGVVELASGLALIRRVLRGHAAGEGAVIKQFEPVNLVHRLGD